MGYNLIIGEKFAEINDDGNTYVTVKTVKLDNAPADGVPTDHTNERWPSYTGWYEFFETTGLKHLFKGHKGLIRTHPGWVKLTIEHKAEIDRAFTNIKLYPPEHQVRLEWLKFWVDWALDNCTYPIFKNS